MNRIILSVDMDMFFAAVEIRDNPELKGKPLIIGALPHERGVVSTCSYEARKYGVRSAMSIKEAYRLCPQGIYMHPNMKKYKEASDAVHGIWAAYTDLIEYVSLDEGFMDITGSAHLFGAGSSGGGAEKIANEIKKRTKSETGLTCSVGIGYSIMSAKLASEELKPDGLFSIPNPESLISLIIRFRKFVLQNIVFFDIIYLNLRSRPLRIYHLVSSSFGSTFGSKHDFGSNEKLKTQQPHGFSAMKC